MRAELPELIAVRTRGLSAAAAAALAAASNRSDWIRQAIEQFASPQCSSDREEFAAIRQELAKLREEISRLQVAGGESLATSPQMTPEPTTSSPEAARAAAASILEAFNL